MEADEYRKMAAVEDGMWYYRALHARIIRRFIKSGSAEPVLDAGCGTGGLLRRMEREGRVQHATGVDFSPLACELSRARTQARIVEANLVALPFANGEFGTVISADVLYHVPDDGAALLIFSGTQLVMLGVIGEYIGRMFISINRRPQSVVREVVKSGAGLGT